MMILLFADNTLSAGLPRPSQRNREADTPAVSASGSRASTDLVEGRAGHLIRLHLRRALHHRLQCLQDTGIRAPGIGLRVFFQVPHADTDRLRSAGGEEQDFVLEALLLSEHGDDVLVEEPGELFCTTGLEMEGNGTSKHVNLLVGVPRGGTR